MTAVSPGSFTNLNPDHYYKDRAAYLGAATALLKREYEAIAAAGLIVQVDSPDLAMHSSNFPDMPVEEWYGVVAENVDAINAATASIPREKVRVHVCWGASPNPHNHDTELKDIVGLLMKLRASAVSIVAGNGRHQHEWKSWKGVAIPDGMSIVIGVIDNATMTVEHPETVAERLVRFAEVIGRDRVIASVDCGFGTTGTSAPPVAASVMWAKLGSLVEGARLASRELWGR
jgi:5-methyltetrahydropteroyltriglutamate--homocysteine methyltransferase